MQKVRDLISEYNTNTVAMKEEIDTIEAAILEAKEELENENRILNAHNEEFNDLCAIHERKSKELVELNLRIQKITHENERFQKERLSSQQSVNDFEKQYDWIADEKQ
jgi:chromosome segregation ATPase